MGLLLKSLPFLHSGAEGVSGHQGEKGDIPLPTWGVGAVPEALNAVSSTAWGQRRSVRGCPLSFCSSGSGGPWLPWQ